MASAKRYAPARSFSKTIALATARRAAMTAMLPHGKVLIGARTREAGSAALGECRTLRPASGTRSRAVRSLRHAPMVRFSWCREGVRSCSAGGRRCRFAAATTRLRPGARAVPRPGTDTRAHVPTGRRADLVRSRCRAGSAAGRRVATRKPQAQASPRTQRHFDRSSAYPARSNCGACARRQRLARLTKFSAPARGARDPAVAPRTRSNARWCACTPRQPQSLSARIPRARDDLEYATRRSRRSVRGKHSWPALSVVVGAARRREQRAVQAAGLDRRCDLRVGDRGR